MYGFCVPLFKNEQDHEYEDQAAAVTADEDGYSRNMIVECDCECEDEQLPRRM